MTQTTAGWIVFIAALGMMCAFLAIDVANLKDWSQVSTPSFVGACIGHIGATITAFVGGKLIPNYVDQRKAPPTIVLTESKG